MRRLGGAKWEGSSFHVIGRMGQGSETRGRKRRGRAGRTGWRAMRGGDPRADNSGRYLGVRGRPAPRVREGGSTGSARLKSRGTGNGCQRKSGGWERG